jgi:hypothetical protein
MPAIRILLLAVAVLAFAGLTACGSDGDETAATRTVTQTVQQSVQTRTPTPDPTTTEEPAAVETESGQIRIPDVEGEDHQLAQDTMQAAGLYNLSEEDATGQGRLLILDRNWTVVEQDPPAGTLVREDQTITLSSKKDGE